MRSLRAAIVLATSLLWSSVALAQDAHDPHVATADMHASGEAGMPALPHDASWAGVMVIVILVGFFLPAAVIGPIARALAPEDEPDTHAHDEHGGSHGHGHSDTAHAHGHHH